MSNKKGFTLIEMILVLSILCLTSLFSISIRSPHPQKNNTIENIQYFFHQAKINSMLNKEKTSITLSNNQLSYSSEHNHFTIYLTDGKSQKKYSFYYNENGNIYKASTVNFIIDNQLVQFVFQVGSGSFDVK